ncbi:MAG TPA: AMP-binding protein [Proteiniphilum sp.]|nr:AMP-binding protein [Proteiniphilum sp.]HPJ50819.1 AMP-binding protein [Proteiniphilum sp.]HPR20186.1 AMP-binding protein [Proteiniphilum sp.]
MNSITIEGVCYRHESFLGKNLPSFASLTPFHRQLALFLKEWYTPSPLLTLHTSGSTGNPKAIAVRKEQMMQSAAITCDYLKLKEGETALLCLPLEYIAGKMMVVRALYGGLNLLLADPSGRPLAGIDHQIDFAAMVPLQVYNSLEREEEKERLMGIGKLIIGGGAIDPQLEAVLKDYPHPIYSTYGMTETVSHIALRRISGQKATEGYIPLPGVRVKMTEEGTLLIDAPLVADVPVITNDITEIAIDGSFRIMGRKDNVVNSGGIKIQIEAMEEVLRPHIGYPFAVTSIPDPKLGEALVLLITPSSDPASIGEICSQYLHRLEQPKHILVVEYIPLTGSGKTDRKATKKMASEQVPMPGNLSGNG